MGTDAEPGSLNQKHRTLGRKWSMKEHLIVLDLQHQVPWFLYKQYSMMSQQIFTKIYLLGWGLPNILLRNKCINPFGIHHVFNFIIRYAFECLKNAATTLQVFTENTNCTILIGCLKMLRLAAQDSLYRAVTKIP